MICICILYFFIHYFNSNCLKIKKFLPDFVQPMAHLAGIDGLPWVDVDLEKRNVLAFRPPEAPLVVVDEIVVVETVMLTSVEI